MSLLDKTLCDKPDGSIVEDAQIEIAAADAKQWKIAAEIHEKHQEFEKALSCWCNALRLSCASEKSDEVALYGQCLVSSGCQLIQPSESFYRQDLLTQLYALGCGFYRNQRLSEAICTLEAAVVLYNFHLQMQSEEKLNTDETLLMKIYFELACCKEQGLQLDSCIVDFRTSLLLAVHNNDVSFEKMILLRFCNVLLRKELFVEATSGYIRLLSIKSDIKKTLNDDMLKFKAHWTVECDCEIRYGLCIAYKSLHLYERAVSEGLIYKQLLISLPSVHLSKPRLRSPDVITHMMEINFILGEIYESMNDLSSSLKVYQEWLEELRKVAASKSGLALQIELSSAYQSVGRVYFKLKDNTKAQECFSYLVKIGQLSNILGIAVNGMLLQGDLLLAQKDFDGARNMFGQALKFSQAVPDDSYELECKCMAKEAEVFAKEHRYTHALYRCEQAIIFGKKSEQNFSLVDFERQAALYSQHSSSGKELAVALKFLLDEILSLESKLQSFKVEGVVHLHSEEKILYKDYIAVQVILHRLGEQKLSLAFSECLKGRKLRKAKNALPIIPRVQLKDIPASISDEHVCVVDASQLLDVENCETILAFAVTDGGLLIHVHNDEQNLTKSYLSSDHVVDPHLIESRLTELVESIYGQNRSSATEKVQLMYNTENRCLPDSSLVDKHLVKTVFKQRSKQVDGGGDHVEDDVKTTIHDRCGLEQGDNGDAKKEEAKCKGGNEETPLKELYKLLIQPVENVLDSLPEHSSICISVDGLLAKIPFDHVINPVDGKLFGEKYNIISTSCLQRSDQVARRVETSNSKHTINRREELQRNFDDPTDFLVLEEIGMDKNLSGLVSSTASGTNILSSSQYMAPYKQAKYFDKSCVIGNPEITKSLELCGRQWKPQTRLFVAQQECRQVAGYLGVSPIMGRDATKAEFLKQMCEASVVHVATYGLFDKGVLAFCPDLFPLEKEPISAQRCMVTLQDLLDARPLAAKLVVLSSGQTWTTKAPSSIDSIDLDLPRVLLAAGVRCVVFPLWSVPDNITETFHYHFYKHLQAGTNVSRALFLAKAATKEKHPNPILWNAFTVVGNDVIVNLSEVRRSEIHQSISGLESNLLSPSTIVQSEKSFAVSYLAVQRSLSRLAGHLDVSRDNDVIPFLLGLLEEATDRLTKDENDDRPLIILPEAVQAIIGTMELLELVGFDFQNVSISSLPPNTKSSFTDRTKQDAKMIVFPHWNQDGLLLPVHQVLSGLNEICSNEEALRALSLLLPISDELLLCKLIDFLAVLHHTPHVQLRITDQNTSVLWNNTKIHNFLQSIGVTNVRASVVFHKTIENKSLLMSALQLLLAVCQHRRGQILEELHVETLGLMPIEKEQPKKALNSISAVVMPRNEILLTSSWSGGDGHVDECGDRKELATNITHVKQKYNRVLEHAKWWHQDLKIPKQLSRGLPTSDDKRPSSQRKVKVQSGSTPSCNRLPMEEEASSTRPTLFEVLRRREEARNVLQKRCSDIKERHASALRSSYLPFVKTGHK